MTIPKNVHISYCKTSAYKGVALLANRTQPIYLHWKYYINPHNLHWAKFIIKNSIYVAAYCRIRAVISNHSKTTWTNIVLELSGWLLLQTVIQGNNETDAFILYCMYM